MKLKIKQTQNMKKRINNVLVATSGTVKVNGNLEEINKRGGIGCQLVEINDEHLMAVNGRTLRSFTGCGRGRFKIESKSIKTLFDFSKFHRMNRC